MSPPPQRPNATPTPAPKRAASSTSDGLNTRPTYGGSPTPNLGNAASEYRQPGSQGSRPQDVPMEQHLAKFMGIIKESGMATTEAPRAPEGNEHKLVDRTYLRMQQRQRLLTAFDTLLKVAWLLPREQVMEILREAWRPNYRMVWRDTYVSECPDLEGYEDRLQPVLKAIGWYFTEARV